MRCGRKLPAEVTSAMLTSALEAWEVVQRQDTWLWTTESGFESLLPSQQGSCSSPLGNPFTRPHL